MDEFWRKHSFRVKAESANEAWNRAYGMWRTWVEDMIGKCDRANHIVRDARASGGEVRAGAGVWKIDFDASSCEFDA